MQLYLDRLGSASGVKAATCTWDSSACVLIISTDERFLRTDSSSVADEIYALAANYGASFDVTAETNMAPGGLGERENTLVFRMRFPWTPGPSPSLLEISILICSFMWGCPAAESEGNPMGSFIKTPAQDTKAVADAALKSGKKPSLMSTFNKPWNDVVDKNVDKKSNYQQLYENLMAADAPLSEMELKN